VRFNDQVAKIGGTLNQGFQKRYLPEVKERAVRIVLETIEENAGRLLH
jgi:hypothetical protein